MTIILRIKFGEWKDHIIKENLLKYFERDLIIKIFEQEHLIYDY